MAVDTLAFASRGIYDASGTAQSVINARFASWGMVGAGATPQAGTSYAFIPNIPSMATIPNIGRFIATLIGVITLDWVKQWL